MAGSSLEERVSNLEGEVARLKQCEEERAKARLPWWEQVWGSFRDDPDYEEAMRLGREYRQAQRLEYDDEPEQP